MYMSTHVSCVLDAVCIMVCMTSARAFCLASKLYLCILLCTSTLRARLVNKVYGETQITVYVNIVIILEILKILEEELFVKYVA